MSEPHRHLLAFDADAEMTSLTDGTPTQSESVIVSVHLNPSTGVLVIQIEHPDETETTISMLAGVDLQVAFARETTAA